MKHLTFILVFISASVFGQVNGVVKDSLTGKSISYANIWIEGGGGTTTDYAGRFTFPDSIKNKNVIIYNTGYKIKSAVIDENEVYLSPNSTIKQSNFITEQNKSIETGWDGSTLINGAFSPKGENPVIVAKYFEADRKTKRYPFIKALKGILFFDDPKNTKIFPSVRVRFFKVNKDGSPGEEIGNKDFIISIQQEQFAIDLSEHKVIMPENGIFVGIEWLLIEKNSITNPDGTVYMPFAAVYPSKENNLWQFRGSWKKKDKNDRTGKYDDLAFSLILTD